MIRINKIKIVNNQKKIINKIKIKSYNQNQQNTLSGKIQTINLVNLYLNINLSKISKIKSFNLKDKM